jgi:transposase
MNKISVIGLDLAKNVFQVHGVDGAGEVVVRKQLKRSQVRRFFTNVEPCLVCMEACGGAHYWSRELAGLGHTVRMMAPVFVKPYLKYIPDMPRIAGKVTFVPQAEHADAGRP